MSSSSTNTNTNTSFAVLGGNGTLSPFIINSLSKQPSVKKLIVLSRASSSSKPSASSLPANAELISVDYDDHTALVDIFKKYSTDVVISTLSHSASLDAQKKSAAAAKEAGVKLFVPSEYGLVTVGYAGKGKPLSNKDEFAGTWMFRSSQL
jgi:saccharopine dehydrogenase-like NADP-dependent oxidoreductase